MSDQVRERICLIARTAPAGWKMTAFSTWSLAKLAEHLVKRAVIPAISRETPRRILHAGRSPGRPPPGRPRTARPSLPRCTGPWASATPRPPTAGSCAWTSSGR
ncbi:hypothetical protein [Streptomyces sp. NBC_00233]|uniref:hypothetical protein n=1 Tax=Streptomyces sp. NBC_00233 TaxID=2975686 RepID=UPI00338E578F